MKNKMESNPMEFALNLILFFMITFMLVVAAAYNMGLWIGSLLAMR